MLVLFLACVCLSTLAWPNRMPRHPASAPPSLAGGAAFPADVSPLHAASSRKLPHAATRPPTRRAAYWVIANNEVYHCGVTGLSAGQGAGVNYMTPPWIQARGRRCGAPARGRCFLWSAPRRRSQPLPPSVPNPWCCPPTAGPQYDNYDIRIYNK